ncbi:MAG: amidohydrolase family protein [Planctomycetota bacterium]
MILPALALLFGPVPACPQSTPAPAPASPVRPWILRADRILTGDGEEFEKGAVLLRGGRILAVGASVPVPANAVEVRLHGTLAPGFVDAFSGFGLEGRVTEDSRPLSAGLRVRDSLDRRAPLWRELLAAGVTSIHVVPEPANVAAGWGALVHPGDPSALVGTPETRQVFSLLFAQETHEVYDEVFGPTSLAGAGKLLAEVLEQGIPGLKEKGALVFVDSPGAARLAREQARRHDLDAVLVALGDPGAYGRELAGRLVGLPALGEGSLGPRAIEVLRRLHGSGVRIAFGTRFTGSSQPDALRMSAMALSRITGDPGAALASITANAAELAGVARRTGRIAPGARADLVLWSGHPLDAAARVKAILVEGRSLGFRTPVEEP